MRTVLLNICVFIYSFLAAQSNCVTDNYLQQQRMTDAGFLQRTSQIETFLKLHTITNLTATSREGLSSLIKIPVVVHVIYKDPGGNISDAQVKSQIDALNRDYRRWNPDTLNTPDRFKDRAADVQIEFDLATATPDGRPTTGIVRKATGITYFTNNDRIKYSSQGGDDAWDSRYYLNIWVGNLYNLLGYSSIPGSPADKDGVVIAFSAFGTINVAAPFNLGRTAVHEVGHWLNLKHIWGDAPCGDDLVDDTPVQGTYTIGCPNGFKSSCNNGSLGDMYMNYMDLSNDGCMNLFTLGQKARMRALFDKGGPRYDMLSSRGLLQPWATNGIVLSSNGQPLLETGATARIYPNPARDMLTLSVGNNWTGKTIQLCDRNGAVIRTIMITNSVQQINVASLPAGLYFLTGESNNDKLKQKFVKM